MHIPEATHTSLYNDKLHAVIEAFFTERLNRAGKIHPHYQELWAEAARLIGSGGKRFRPRMAILSYCMFNGDDVEAILPAAAALELLHLGMLIHDDVIDRDYVRYGVDNIAGGYKKRYSHLVTNKDDQTHYAHSAALLAGDLMISEAYLLMAESSVDARTIIATQKLLGQSIYEVVGGELLDTEAAFRGGSTVSPELIALHKTASYTFTMPFLVGAELAGASAEEKEQLRVFGKNLGIAYQLRDDVIGVFGNEAETGKSTSGDIREGKRTYMVEQFYALASIDQRNRFDAYFGHQSLTDEECEEARALLRDSGALDKTEQTIAAYEAEARKAMATLSINPLYQDQLDELIHAVTQRVK